jgi:hypothetical protein
VSLGHIYTEILGYLDSPQDPSYLDSAEDPSRRRALDLDNERGREVSVCGEAVAPTLPRNFTGMPRCVCGRSPVRKRMPRLKREPSRSDA